MIVICRMMDIILLVLLVFLHTPAPSLAQFRGCPMEILTDQEGIVRLVANAIADANDSAPLTSVAILKNHTVYLSVGPVAGTISSMSLLVEYERSNSEGNTTILVEQFDFGCRAVSNAFAIAWTASQFGHAGSRSPTATFSTELRRDCSACIEEGVAREIHIDLLYHVDPVSHCLACSSSCADTGMGVCFGLGQAMCCNYFLNGSCVNICPNTTQPDSDYNCQRVVVGFNKTVYMVEERQGHVSLPVVVKEGQLTERVLLQVTTEDRTTSAENDYQVSNRRVKLIPGVNDNSGKVKVKVRNDDLSEESEEFLVRLEVISGSALVDISFTMVIILGNDDESPTNVTSATTSTPTTLIEDGCKPDIDEAWKLEWPSTAQGRTALVPCGQDKTGFATRKCLSGAVWAAANVSLCENTLIAEIGKMAKELFAQPDVHPDEALVVVRELAEATMATASSSKTSQLPRDLATVSDIIAGTVELLLQSTSADTVTKVSINETAVVIDVLNIILTSQNQDGFSSLHDDNSSAAGGNAVLNTAEKYSQYVSQTLATDDTNNEHILFSRENIVLFSERTNSNDIQPGTEDEDIIFPRMNELHGIVTSGSAPAAVKIPAALLQYNFDGNVSVTNVFFRDMHHLLPTIFDNGTVPRSFVVSSQVHGRRMKKADPLPFRDTPITITFRLELNDTHILPRCAFWDFSKGVEKSGWSTDGLRTESVTRDGNTVTVTCASFHLTSFAVLVDVGGAQIDHKPLAVVSYIGISLSLVCLLFTILFFASLGKKLFTAVHNFIHLNLCVALFVAYFTFAVGIEVATDNEAGCKAVAALIQYFLLAAFCWMMCEGIMLYLMLVVVFSSWSKKWWLYFAVGWGVPVIFVVIGLSSVLDEYGVRASDGELLYCWLASGNNKHAIWTFVAPMLGIIAVNTVLLVLVMRSIYLSKSSQGSTRKADQKHNSVALYIVKASVILLPLLGLTWVIGMFAINENTAVFAWLFTIFNSMQGVSIFVLHVVRNERVWGRIRKSMNDPDSFVRTLSQKTTRFSFMSLTRISKHSGDSGDASVEMRAHTSKVHSGSSIYHSQDLEHVFEPRESGQCLASKEHTDRPTITRNGSTTKRIPDNHDLTCTSNTDTPTSNGFSDCPNDCPTDVTFDKSTNNHNNGLTIVCPLDEPTDSGTEGEPNTTTVTYGHIDDPVPTNGPIDSSTDGPSDGGNDGPTNETTDGPTGETTADSPTDETTDVPSEGTTDGPTDDTTEGPTNHTTDGLTDQCIGGPTDIPSDGPTIGPANGPTASTNGGSNDNLPEIKITVTTV